MTANNLMFTLDNVAKLTYVNNVWYPLVGTLASNITRINFNSYDLGAIVYNDRPPLPAAFQDPSPYQSFLNSWIASGAAVTPALTLAQAQSVKAGLIDSIFYVKSQVPVTVATSLGSFNFDVTPNDPNSVSSSLPAVSNLISQLASINNAIGTAFTALATAIDNTIVAGIDNAINNAGFNSVNGQLAEMAAEWNANVSIYNGYIDIVNAGGGGGYPHMNNAGFGGNVGGVSNIGTTGYYTPPTGLPTLTAPVKMLPIGSTSYPAFTVGDLFKVLAAAQTQLSNETLVRAQKQAALAALSSITAVIAYDATTGW